MKELDIEIYKVLSELINASEIYLGHKEYDFIYGKTEYRATCTEAFPFNAFDNAICGLLQVEDTLSFHDIGNLLGMNVGSLINENILKDNAEYEILIEALQSLSKYNMIEGGDLSFSRCQLTDIGKEYAAKKHKFKKIKNKPFTIYFDRTTENHKQAKANFEFVEGDILTKKASLDKIDSIDLKEIAGVQVPDVYNPKMLYSFTDEVVSSAIEYSITYDIAVTFDIQEGTYKFYCYIQSRKHVHMGFSNWISEQESIKEGIIENLKINNQIPNSQSIDALPVLVDSLPKQKLSSFIDNIVSNQFIDQYFVFTYLKCFIEHYQKVDLYLCLPVLNETLYKSTKELIQVSQHLESRLFIVLPNDLSPLLTKEVDDFISLGTTMKNLYIMMQDVKSFVFMVKNQTDSFSIEFKETKISDVPITLAQKSSYDSKAIKIEHFLLSKFSSLIGLSLCSEADTIINSNNEEPINREQLERLDNIEFKLGSFTEIGEHVEVVQSQLELIANFKRFTIERLNSEIINQVNEVTSSISNLKDNSELLHLKSKLTDFENKLINPTTAFQTLFKDTKDLVLKRQLEIEELERAYSFIIDTNILLEEPELIIRVDRKHSIIIAAKVLDELDKFKLDKNLTAKVSKAVKLINQNINKNIRHTKGKPDLLPSDFNQKSPDNLILSVALQYQKNKGILVTSDNILAMKAQNVLDLTVLNLQEFKIKFDPSYKS